jgi:hypothetical protein
MTVTKNHVQRRRNSIFLRQGRTSLYLGLAAGLLLATDFPVLSANSAHTGRGRQLANREILPCSCDADCGRSDMEEAS